MKYYKFTENNDWEGESWNFYLPLTDEQHQKLTELIVEMDETYRLAVKPLDESTVDAKHGKGSTTYMDKHNKCGPVKELPDKIDWEKDDPFYKGQFWEILEVDND